VDEVLRAEARQIGFALTRIDNGTYGTCTNCGERIALARLEAEPAATRCIKCAD
jgi:RNA polymerase-binding transcription factor DksA